MRPDGQFFDLKKYSHLQRAIWKPGVQSALMIVHQVLPGQAKEDGFP
jgi:hypothetical protein